MPRKYPYEYLSYNVCSGNTIIKTKQILGDTLMLLRCCNALLHVLQFYFLLKNRIIIHITGADPGFGQGGAPASEAESCRRSEAELHERSEQSAAGVQGQLKGMEAFGFLMLKYAFSHILETLFLSFLTSILTPKVDKNRTLEFTSINLRHSYILHLFFNLHEKVML